MYSVLYADPPWTFRRAGDSRRTADSQYPCLTTAEICAMDAEIDPVMEAQAACFLWATCATLPDALQVMGAWGFLYKTVAGVWAKLATTELEQGDLKRAIATGGRVIRYGEGYRRLHFGMGHYTRAQAELLLLGVRGRMEVADRGVPQIIWAPVREHSRKPDEAYEMIERLYPSHAYLELFARARRGGWVAHGDEVHRFEASR